MELDLPYLNKLNTFIQASDNKIYNVAELTDDSDKLIFHLKYYIDHRSGDDLHIDLNCQTETEKMYAAQHEEFKITDYKKFKVLEFFEGKIRENKEKEIVKQNSNGDGYKKIQEANAGRTETIHRGIRKEIQTNSGEEQKQTVVNNKGLFQ